MQIEIFEDAAAAAVRAADWLAAQARTALAARGRCRVALSGGRTPAAMLRAWSAAGLDWENIDLLQVDERVAPEGSPARNLTHLQTELLDRLAPRAPRVHPMPVETADLETAAETYARQLQAVCGIPAVLDVVHLGLGADGHTASLFPDDPDAARLAEDVVITTAHHGYQRMTLTRPVLDRARRVLWVVTGADKAEALRRLVDRDATIPAGRVRQEAAVLLADRAAAARLPAN